MVAGLLGGIAIAIVAHKKHGYMSSIFLVGHMISEWCRHPLHGSHYDFMEITLHGVHTVLDMVFRYLETKTHYAKYSYLFLFSGAVVLGSVFAYYYVPGIPA